jgi:hypothetical protein
MSRHSSCDESAAHRQISGSKQQRLADDAVPAIRGLLSGESGVAISPYACTKQPEEEPRRGLRVRSTIPAPFPEIAISKSV